MEHKVPSIWWLFFPNSHFKLHHCSCRNSRWCKVLLVLRNTVSAGSLVSWELWVLGAPRKRPSTAKLLHNKGRGDLHPSRWPDTQRHGRSWRAQDFHAFSLWKYKSPGFPHFRVLPQRYQLKLLLFYMVIASRLNYFKDWDIWDSAIGNLRLSR